MRKELLELMQRTKDPFAEVFVNGKNNENNEQIAALIKRLAAEYAKSNKTGEPSE